MVIALFCLLLTDAIPVSAQHVSLRNNLLYDATLTPNLGIDIQTSDHWSWGLLAGFRPWPTNDDATKKLRHLLIAPEVRRWQVPQQVLRLPKTDSLYRSHANYWGLNAIYSHYNVGGVKFPFGLYKEARDHRLQGDLAAVGAFVGRTWRISPLLRIEAEVGMAVGYTWYKKYDCVHCGTYHGKDNKPFLLPKVALSIVLDRQKKAPAITIPPIDTMLLPPPPPPAPVLVLHPVTPNTGRAGMLQADNPVLQHISQYRPYDRTRILRKEEGALYVNFPLDGSVIDRDYRNNAQTLDRIIDITRQIMADSTSMVKCIQIVGLASIEGAVARNELLSEKRANALQQYIQQQVPEVSDSLFDTAAGGEAWTELLDQLNDALTVPGGSPSGAATTITATASVPGGLPAGAAGTITAAALQQAIDMINSEPDLTRREQRLRALNGGRTYQYIRQNLLPDQRNSGYLRIFFDFVPDEAAATINRASELLQEERYQEALELLQTVSDDERAQNALGVALFNTGQMGYAIQCFERAAQSGNADAQENLRQMYRQLER